MTADEPAPPTALTGSPIPISQATGNVQFVQPTPGVSLVDPDPGEGCADCGTQDTVQLHPHRGRLCPEHITLPPGPFRTDLAEHMVELQRADSAFAYLAAWLQRAADERFDRASDAIGVAW